jgi:hypothetical protein
MLEIDQTTDRYRLTSASLRLTFDRSGGDRWRHAIDVRIDNDWRRVLDSVEGTAAEADPPSPAIQDLRLEVLNPDTAEFQLFGQAGRRVYSAAVRFDGTHDAVDFDICCRLPTQHISGSVISSYVWTSDCREGPVPEGAQPTRLYLLPHPIEIELPPSTDQSSGRWRTATHPSGPVLQLGRFADLPATTGSSLKTIRWRYVVRVR